VRSLKRLSSTRFDVAAQRTVVWTFAHPATSNLNRWAAPDDKIEGNVLMKQCYLCGEKLVKNKNKSKDHVPPDCIFPQDKPPNLMTVPCCKRCNEEYKQLDERMRNYLALLAVDKTASVGETARREVLRSRKWREVFLSYTKQHPNLVDDNGNPRLVFFFDENELKPWLVRIVKGLFYKLNRTRIGDAAVFKVEKYPQFNPQPSETFPMEKGLEYRPYFVYGVVHEENNDFWVLIFYDRLMFSVSVDFPV
jgi:hypothetical protein